MIEEGEVYEIWFDDGVELIIERAGRRVLIFQRVYHVNDEGREETEEWHVAEGSWSRSCHRSS